MISLPSIPSGAGILPLSPYTYLFIISLNPIFYKLFKPKHWFLFAAGVLLSFLNHRAIIPFILLCCLDLDYSRLGDREKKLMLAFFALQLFILLAFGGNTYGS